MEPFIIGLDPEQLDQVRELQALNPRMETVEIIDWAVCRGLDALLLSERARC